MPRLYVGARDNATSIDCTDNESNDLTKIARGIFHFFLWNWIALMLVLLWRESRCYLFCCGERAGAAHFPMELELVDGSSCHDKEEWWIWFFIGNKHIIVRKVVRFGSDCWRTTSGIPKFVLSGFCCSSCGCCDQIVGAPWVAFQRWSLSSFCCSIAFIAFPGCDNHVCYHMQHNVHMTVWSFTINVWHLLDNQLVWLSCSALGNLWADYTHCNLFILCPRWPSLHEFL